MFRKLTSFVLCIVLLFGFTFTANAAEVDALDQGIIVMRYSCITSASSTLTLSGNTATARGNVGTHSSTAKIYICSTLQKNIGGYWYDVSGASWSNSTTGWSATASGSITIGSGTYRVSTYYSVTCCGMTESGTVYSTTKTY